MSAASTKFCAICNEATDSTDGTSYEYDINDKQGRRLYAFVHAGDCEREWEQTACDTKKLANRAGTENRTRVSHR